MGGSTLDRFKQVKQMTFTYERRLATFSQFNWPHTGKKYTSQPEDFAQAGFYCRPMVGSEDTVACFLCFKGLDGWEPTDSAWQEHKSHSAVCPLVTLNLFSSRLRTFDRWLGEKVKGGVDALAAAGFFHFPKSDGDDTCICYQCGLALDGWEANDDPQHEHSRRRPNCPHILGKGYLKPASFDFILAGKSDENAIKDISTSYNNNHNSITPMKSRGSHPLTNSTKKIKLTAKNEISVNKNSQPPQNTPQSQKSTARIVVSSTAKKPQNLAVLEALFPGMKTSDILKMTLEELMERLIKEKVENFDKFLRLAENHQ